MTISTQQRRSRWSIMGLGVSLLLLGAGLSLYGMTGAHARPSVASTLPPAVDPRLILHRQTAPFSGAIAGGVTLGGTLTPSLPGLNTISLRILLPGGQVALGGRVSLLLTMPGMAMRPVRVALTASGQGYRGSVTLPMFGRYRARVVAATAAGRYAGALSVTLPLTLTSLSTSADTTHP